MQFLVFDREKFQKTEFQYTESHWHISYIFFISTKYHLVSLNSFFKLLVSLLNSGEVLFCSKIIPLTFWSLQYLPLNDFDSISIYL